MPLTVLDNGVDELALATAAQRVFTVCTMGYGPAYADERVMRELRPNDGWLNLGVLMLAKYVASDAGTMTHTFVDLARECRANFFRGLTGDTPPVPFEALPVRERLAWECVARHAAWMSQADDLRSEEEVAVRWGAKMHEYARTRGLQLEHPD